MSDVRGHRRWSCSRSRWRSGCSPTSCRSRSARAGSRFPRLNLLSFWLYRVGRRDRLRQLPVPRPPRPASRRSRRSPSHVFSNTPGVDAWIVGTGLAILGFVCFAVNLVVTLRNMRAPGHGLAPRPAVHLGGGPVRLPAARRRPGDARRADHAVHRPPLRRRVLRSRARAARRSSTSTSPGSSSPAPTCIVCLRRRRDLGRPADLRAQSPCSAIAPRCARMLAIAVLGPLAWMQNMYTAPIPSASRSSRCCSRSR